MMHIFSMKRQTKKRAIETIDNPPVLFLSLSQHIGKPSEPIVSVGDRVKKYQLVAKASGIMSANVHAPVSGVIKSIEKHPLADGTVVDMIVFRK